MDVSGPYKPRRVEPIYPIQKQQKDRSKEEQDELNKETFAKVLKKTRDERRKK